MYQNKLTESRSSKNAVLNNLMKTLAHHERWDGSGYPQGLQGKNIPVLARITAIADAFEVMSSGRPYKIALTPEEIAAEFKKCSGTQFDPELVKILLALMEDQKLKNDNLSTDF